MIIIQRIYYFALHLILHIASIITLPEMTRTWQTYPR